MMPHPVCPLCNSSDISEITFSDVFKIGRRKISVNGLSKIQCHGCGEEYVASETHDANMQKIKAKRDATSGAISVGMMIDLRDMWKLTQREASALFGAGASSFAKWESQQVAPSTPSALLLQTAVKFPAVVPYLAQLAKVSLAVDCAGWRYLPSATIITLDVRSPSRKLRPVPPSVTPRYRDCQDVQYYK